MNLNDINILLTFIYDIILLFILCILIKQCNVKFNMYWSIKKHINSNMYYYCFNDIDIYYSNYYKSSLYKGSVS